MGWRDLKDHLTYNPLPWTEHLPKVDLAKPWTCNLVNNTKKYEKYNFIVGVILCQAASCLHIFPGRIDVITIWKRDRGDIHAYKYVWFGIMVKMLISIMDVTCYLQEFPQNTTKSFMGWIKWFLEQYVMKPWRTYRNKSEISRLML